MLPSETSELEEEQPEATAYVRDAVENHGAELGIEDHVPGVAGLDVIAAVPSVTPRPTAGVEPSRPWGFDGPQQHPTLVYAPITRSGMRLSFGRAVRGLYRRLNPMTLTPATIREHDAQAADRETTDTATFGLGCFWGPDARFGAMDGVVRTRVGYAGGTKPDPSYHSLGDHTEVVQIDFDPDIVTYRDLVEDAFQQHDPRTQSHKTQYQNVVFTSTATQRTAVDSVLAASGYTADGVETRLEQLSRFYPAEDYHQKYRLRSASLLSAFEEAGYTDEEIRESHIAAKLNGYVAGHDVDIGADLPAPDQHASG